MGASLIERLVAARDVLTGKTYRVIAGTDGNNRAQPIRVGFHGSMNVRAGPSQADAFGRFRASAPHGLFDMKQVVDQASLVMEATVSGGGTVTHLPLEAASRLRVTASSGDVAAFQSREYVPYQPGRSQLVFVTSVLGSIKANVTQRVGAFDAAGGMFFEQNGATKRVVVRSNTTGFVVDTPVDQSSWNMDRLDGTGPSESNPSGVLLDTSKAQVFVFDYSWLGVGSVRFGFLLEGQLVYCHEFKWANGATATGVYTQTGSLPIRYEIRNTAASVSQTDLIAICASVFSEGGFDPVGVVVSQDSGTASRSAASNSRMPVLAVRLKPSHSRGLLIPKSFDALSQSNTSMLVQVFLRVTGLTGGTFTGIENSAAEYNVAATAFSDGICVASAYASSAGARAAGNVVESALKLAANSAGATDVMVLAVTPLGGNANVHGSLTWKEVY